MYEPEQQLDYLASLSHDVYKEPREKNTLKRQHFDYWINQCPMFLLDYYIRLFLF